MLSVNAPTDIVPMPKLPCATVPPEAIDTVPPIVPLPPKVAPVLTVTVPVANVPGLFTSNVPPLTFVPPVCWFAPVRSRVPKPALINVPEVAADPPDMVRVVVADSTSRVPVEPALMVKLRSVLGVVLLVSATTPLLLFSALFTYRSVPPLKTKLLAALDEVPMLLLAPPLASALMARVPLVSVVEPRYEAAGIVKY